MKKKSVLAGQSIKRRQARTGFDWLGVLRKVFSVSFKTGLLLASVAAVSALFLFLYQHLISSPYLRLEQVSITGVSEEIRRELIEFSGLDSGQSLLTINLNSVKAKMEKHPWIKSVDLEKHFPHTLAVKVEKEVPFAVVAMGRMFYMNKWGEIFTEVTFEDPKDFPVITGITEEKDSALFLRFAARILDVLKTNSGAWSLDEISEIHFNNADDVYLYSTSLSAVVKIGSDESALKSGELKKVIEHLTETGRIHMVRSIDLNYNNGAVVSFRKDG